MKKIEHYIRHLQKIKPVCNLEPPRPDDEIYMKECLQLARHAGACGEIPVGAVVLHNGKIIGTGKNTREQEHSALGHAELTAISEACASRGSWRLDNCTLYVTLEPCPMCAGAIEQARIDRVVIGAASDKSGCAGSLLNIVANEKLMHQSEITRDVLADECRGLLQQFFRDLRIRNRMLRKGAAAETTEGISEG